MTVLNPLYTASFNRPANTTAYSSGQLVANDTVAGNVVPMKLGVSRIPGKVAIVRARLLKSGASVASAAFRLHLFKNAAPTVVNGDGATLLSNGAANYVGSFDFPTPNLTGANANPFSDGAHFNGVPVVGNAVVHNCGSDTEILYGLLEARGAYTPASGETFTVNLEVAPASN